MDGGHTSAAFWNREFSMHNRDYGPIVGLIVELILENRMIVSAEAGYQNWMKESHLQIPPILLRHLDNPRREGMLSKTADFAGPARAGKVEERRRCALRL